MPKLIVQQGYNVKSDLEIVAGETIIGRDPSCGFVIPDSEVSRQHAKLVREGERVSIEDLNSINGTFLNSAPVSGRQYLKHADIVQICGNVFVYNEARLAEDLTDRPQRTAEFYTFPFLERTVKQLQQNVEQVFMGKREVVRNAILCLIADGHVLIEDAPGVGKSILAQSIAKSIHGIYKRIQFTPDMLPSDISGISMYDEQERKFRFVPGPIFGNIVLADEINRTTPRTQSSLLECMTDAVVTIDGTPHVLPKPFFVIATQNPLEYHGTYPLPEAQLDRFLMRLSIGYPDHRVELAILASQTKMHPINTITYVARAMDIVQCQALVRQVHVSDKVKEYILAITRATREHPALNLGVSPRASLALMRAGQALAAMNGREYVLPKDIRELAVPVLAHRLALKLRAQGEYDSTDAVVQAIVQKVPMDSAEEA
jgi:MoxR-like ATPase